jgi:hypothetical protein
MKSKSRTSFCFVGPLSLFALLATHCGAQPGDQQGYDELGPNEPGRNDQAVDGSVSETQSALIIDTTSCKSTFTVGGSLPPVTTVVPLGCFRTAPGYHRGGVVATPSPGVSCFQMKPPNDFLTPNPRDGRAMIMVQGSVTTGTCTVAVVATSDCAHAPCTTGSALDPQCSPNVAAICAQHPSCCTSSWDSHCVDDVATIAEESCK